MTSPADWETEGASARAALPGDAVRTPASVRAATWIGIVLLTVAVVVFASAAQVTALDGESEAHALTRTVVLVVIGTGASLLAGVALLLRLVAGVIVRRA